MNRTAASTLLLLLAGCGTNSKARPDTTSSSSASGGTSSGSRGSSGSRTTGTSGSGSRGTSGGNNGGETFGGTIAGGTSNSTGTTGGDIGTNGPGSTGDTGTSGGSGTTGPADAGGYPNGGTTGGLCGFDAGPIQGGTCVPECARGFRCVNGNCVLNGGDGPLQVTLRFPESHDLDLHVEEPGSCEVFYGNPQCVASLDLDSNAGCSIDGVNVENVIWPDDGGAPPTPGTYTVRVDLYSVCQATTVVPFEVVVRKGSVESGFCGLFAPPRSHNGGAGSGFVVTTFTWP